VIWLAAGGAVVLVAALLARSWLLRDDTAPVSVTNVVKTYRGERTATTRLPAGVTIPQAGVYAYVTDGFEKADLLGGSRHDYPSRTTITIRPQGCGYRQTWTALDKRVEAWTFCALAPSRRPTSFRDVHSFYGRSDDRTYACGGGALPLRAEGPPATIACRRDGVQRIDRVRAVGDAPMTVGRRTVATVHLRTTTRMTGSTEGTATFDQWLDRATGLLVRVTADVVNRSDTPIGTKVGYTERYTLQLSSLEPQR
jgi:hypothetical protein